MDYRAKAKRMKRRARLAGYIGKEALSIGEKVFDAHRWIADRVRGRPASCYQRCTACGLVK